MVYEWVGGFFLDKEWLLRLGADGRPRVGGTGAPAGCTNADKGAEVRVFCYLHFPAMAFSVFARLGAAVARLALRAAARGFSTRMAVSGLKGVAPICHGARGGQVRWASNANDDNFADMMSKEFMETIESNPDIKDLMRKFQDLLLSQGFSPEKPPSLMQMMKLYSQSEFRDLVFQLKNKFDEAGIKFSPDQVALLMDGLKK